MIDPITSFRGDHAFLSNFYPVELVIPPWKFPSVEHAYQAGKVDNLGEVDQFQYGTPGHVKRLGQRLPLPPMWDKSRLVWMEILLRMKFQKPHLRRMLEGTSPRDLAEGNTWGDMFWGTCGGIGDNRLGKLLITIRDDAYVSVSTPAEQASHYLFSIAPF